MMNNKKRVIMTTEDVADSFAEGSKTDPVDEPEDLTCLTQIQNK